MPKGVVNCGNCEPWDLFRDGNKGSAYSISIVNRDVSDDSNIFKIGFYYLQFALVDGAQLSLENTSLTIVYHMAGQSVLGWWLYRDGVCCREAELAVQCTALEPTILDGAGTYGPSPLGTDHYYQITIDENSGLPV